MQNLKKIVILLILSMTFALLANATTGFLRGEQVSGMNKICFYDVIGSTYTLNIKSYELCPLTYEF